MTIVPLDLFRHQWLYDGRRLSSLRGSTDEHDRRRSANDYDHRASSDESDQRQSADDRDPKQALVESRAAAR